MKLEVGDEVDQYRIVRELGQGGMGAVYEVEHVKLGVRYALKTFTLEDGHAELFRQRRVSLSARRCPPGSETTVVDAAAAVLV